MTNYSYGREFYPNTNVSPWNTLTCWFDFDQGSGTIMTDKIQGVTAPITGQTRWTNGVVPPSGL